MGLQDDDYSIYEYRALLDWARRAYEYENRKWMEQKPHVRSGYGDRFSNGGGGCIAGITANRPSKTIKKKVRRPMPKPKKNAAKRK